MAGRTKEELKAIGVGLKPTVHVGKEGITDKVVEETRLQVERHGIVKVRVLPSAGMSREEVAEMLASRTLSKLVETRGNTVLLCKASLFESGKRSSA